MPAHNSVAFVGHAITSVQAQTFRDWELIVVDDCSTDDTAAVVERFVAADERVRLVRQRANLGPAHARNAALADARGRYLAFLDSDDSWLPQKLELQLAFMVETEAPISYTAYRRFVWEAKRPGPLIAAQPMFDYRGLLKNPGMACLTVIVDRARTGPLAMPLVHHEDYAFWLRLLKQGFVAQGLNVDLARYRVSNGSVSGNKLRSATWVWRIYRDVEGLGFSYALWCLANYLYRAVRRRTG